MKKIFLGLLAFVFIILTACNNDGNKTPQKSETASINRDTVKMNKDKPANDTSTTTAPNEKLRVSEEHLAKWNGVMAKYALYVQKVSAISSLEQLAGKNILIAFVLLSSEDVTALGGDAKALGTFVTDAGYVIDSFQMNPKPSIHGNPETFLSDFLEKSDNVAFVLKSVAGPLGLTKSPKLVRLSLIQ